MQSTFAQNYEEINEKKKWEIVNVNPDPNGEEWIAGGLRPLSKEETAKMLNTPRMLIEQEKPNVFKRFVNLFSDEILGVGPNGEISKVNNAKLSAFRPIFNQSGNCCSQASGVAYHFTYEWNLLKGTSANKPENQFPSHYTWTFLNHGNNWGSWYFDGWDYIIENGVPTIADYGSIDAGGDQTFWMSGYDKYKRGIDKRVTEYKTIKVNTWEGLNTLRRWMQDHNRDDKHGGLATFSALSAGYKMRNAPSGTEDAGAKIITSWGVGGAHAMTFVGYNDDICFDYNGDGKYTNNIDINKDGVVNLKDSEKGALIIANSWGKSWGDQGFCYLMYNACARDENHGGLQNSNLVHIINVQEKPVLDIEYSLKVKMTHSNRGAMKISLGYNSDLLAEEPSKIYEYYMFNKDGGGYGLHGNTLPADEPFEFGLDFTKLKSWFPTKRGKFFLIIDSKAGKGEVLEAAIIDNCPNGHKASLSNISINTGRTIVPISMVHGSEAILAKDNSKFNETSENNGKISGAVNYKLINAQFSKSGTLTSGDDYTIENTPEGLATNIVVTGTNTMLMNFSGAANFHESINSGKVKLKFNESLFDAEKVVGLNQEFSINFKDAYKIIYSDIDDITASANSTWTHFKMDIGTHGFGAWWYNRNSQIKFEAYENYIVCSPGTSNIKPLLEGNVIGINSKEWYQGNTYPNEPDLDNSNFHEWIGKEAYVGVRLKHDEFNHFGWIRISVAADAKSYTVLDYAFNEAPEKSILAGQKSNTLSTDEQAPTVPTNLVVSKMTQSSATINWKASTDNVRVTFYEILSSGVEIATSSETSVQINNLVPNKNYEFTICANDAAGNRSKSSAVLPVRIKRDVTYCDASGYRGPEHIANVTFGNINNNSSRDAYHDYTAISAEVSQGNTYPISVTIGNYYSGDKAIVWFDWNKDGLFNSNEEQFKLTNNKSIASGDILVPTDANIGNTRMRVRVYYYANAALPCDAKTYGEVEDYTIKVLESVSSLDIERTKPTSSLNTASNLNTEVKLYPNPIANHLKVRGNDIKNIKVYNVIGKLVLTSNNYADLTELDLNFSNLQEGVYLVRIKLNNRKTITKKVIK